MLTDLEDRKTAPPLTVVDKAFVALAILGSAIAIVGLASTIHRYIAFAANSLGTLG